MTSYIYWFKEVTLMYPNIFTLPNQANTKFTPRYGVDFTLDIKSDDLKLFQEVVSKIFSVKPAFFDNMYSYDKSFMKSGNVLINRADASGAGPARIPHYLKDKIIVKPRRSKRLPDDAITISDSCSLDLEDFKNFDYKQHSIVADIAVLLKMPEKRDTITCTFIGVNFIALKASEMRSGEEEHVTSNLLERAYSSKYGAAKLVLETPAEVIRTSDELDSAKRPLLNSDDEASSEINIDDLI